MLRPVKLVLLVCCVLLLTTALRADNWPRFRGPNGEGISADKGIPVKWAKKDMLWKAPMGGGNGSPIVWQDHLFIQSATKDGSSRSLHCIQVSTGKEMWKQTVKGAKAHTHRRNTLASSTPATDGERVYAYIWDGAQIAMYAYDLKGKQVWSTPLGKYKSQHGAGHSPMVYGGNVIFANDQDGHAELMALDAKTGKIVWKTPRKPFRACYSTPFIVKTGTDVELIVTSTAGVAGYDPSNGKENWHWDWVFDRMPLRTVMSSVAGQGLVFAGSGDGAGDRHLVAVKLGGKGDVSKTNLAWEYKKTFPYVPTMLFHGDHLYMVNDRGMAGCYVAKTGKMVWNQRLGGGVSASPVLINGNIYAASEDGNVYVFPAAPKYKLLAKNSVGEPLMATPAVSNNRFFVRGKSNLYCIGAPTR